jgi:hypothetical protein
MNVWYGMLCCVVLCYVMVWYGMVCMYVCIYIYICININTRIYIYIHLSLIHRHFSTWPWFFQESNVAVSVSATGLKGEAWHGYPTDTLDLSARLKSTVTLLLGFSGRVSLIYFLANMNEHGYGSIPISTIFRVMNIHLPAILMFTRGTRF